MNNSVHKFATLVVLLVAVAVEETSSSSGPYCNNNDASADYEAHKAHVLDELANVTPTTQGYSYSTSFPDPAGGHDVVYGAADCTPGVGVSECVSCLIGAKLSLAEICGFSLYGVVKLPLCGMSFVPAVAS
ncbi:unnamed protein product [Linum tenue]|uniref:Gnk2-homologous domain-containing protein n=1 Tax=Linum tenue TaxID=586396 RepID=A0AAV0GVH5_9ROSI|nr:unnamed protein product [Linum tenue]